MKLALVDIMKIFLPKETKVNLEGYDFVLYPKDSDLDFSVYLSGSWERKMSKPFSTFLGEGMVVVDVGASSGYYSFIAARRVGSTGRVFAFEPERLFFNRLVKNVELNKAQRIQCVNLALADYQGVSNFYLSGFAKDQVAKTTTFDVFSKENAIKKVDVVKIDVEGNELKVLTGMSHTLKVNPRAAIFCEIHPNVKYPYGISSKQYAEIVELLKNSGFSVFYLGEERICPINLPVDSFEEPSPFHILAFGPEYHKDKEKLLKIPEIAAVR
jgi:FkbM family methyltransferase